MKPPILFFVFAGISVLPNLPAQVPAPPAPGLAAPAPVQAGYEATVLRKAGNSSVERITSTTAAGITVYTPDGRGLLTLPYDQIESVRFAPPTEWPEITKLIKDGKVADVEAKMLPIAKRMAPMTAVKTGDASKYIFAYTDVLRSLGKYAQAVDFLDKAPFPEDAPVVDRARRIITKAYCLAMLDKADEAEKMLKQVQAPGDKSSLFSIYQLARAKVYAARKDYISSLDEIARVIAVKRLGSESYDEALYQSAEAYDSLKKAIADQKDAVTKDDRLNRQMQQDNIDAIGRFKLLVADPIQVAAIWDADYEYDKCAISARMQLCRVYPTSPWTAKARQKVPVELLKELDDEASRDAVAKAKAQMGDEPEEKETDHKDRTGRNKDAKPESAPSGEVLKLDESSDEKE